MLDVIIALCPAILVSVLFTGWNTLLMYAVSVVSCVGLEWCITKYLLKRPCTIGDLSAVVTALILAMNLPPMTPWWVVLIGAVIAIGVTKLTFGGLGQNIFNPAIVARVFLLVSFPVVMTTYTTGSPLIPGIDAFTGATPLSIVKEGGHVDLALRDTLFAMGGSAGEITDLALILGFIYLLVRKVIKPYITLSIWATVAVFAAIAHAISPEYTGAIFNLFTGGLLLGSIFMATDYVTSPMSNKGGIVFGVGIGLITMIIRYWGAYPEGMSFAILLMNAFVPLINRAFKQRKFGRK